LHVTLELMHKDVVHGKGVDIWAVGVVLYALLFFIGQSLDDIQSLQCAILKGFVDFTCTLWENGSADAIKSLVGWMLTMDPYQN
jgi:hypothetical protein